MGFHFPILILILELIFVGTKILEAKGLVKWAFLCTKSHL